LCCPTVPQECGESFHERPGRHEQIPHDMDWDAIEQEKNEEEGQVDAQLGEICIG
jgi:hypothetical protein